MGEIILSHTLITLFLSCVVCSTFNITARKASVCDCSKLWWVPARNVKDIPPNAVSVGVFSGDDTRVFVARALYKDELVPGKAVASTDGAFIPYHSKEIHVSEYEVLTSTVPVTWVKPAKHDVPFGTVVGGYKEGRPTTSLYVCRAYHEKEWIPGKYIPTHNKCYVPLYGKDWSPAGFEVLVVLQ